MISKYSPRWFTALSSYFPIIFATVCTCWVDVELMQESLSFYSVRIKQSWGGEWRPRPAQLTSFLPLLMLILLFRTIPIISTGHGGRKETDRRAVEEEQEQGLTTTLRLAPTTTTTTTRWGVEGRPSQSVMRVRARAATSTTAPPRPSTRLRRATLATPHWPAPSPSPHRSPRRPPAPRTCSTPTPPSSQPPAWV